MIGAEPREVGLERDQAVRDLALIGVARTLWHRAFFDPEAPKPPTREFVDGLLQAWADLGGTPPQNTPHFLDLLAETAWGVSPGFEQSLTPAPEGFVYI